MPLKLPWSLIRCKALPLLYYLLVKLEPFVVDYSESVQWRTCERENKGEKVKNAEKRGRWGRKHSIKWLSKLGED